MYTCTAIFVCLLVYFVHKYVCLFVLFAFALEPPKKTQFYVCILHFYAVQKILHFGVMDSGAMKLKRPQVKYLLIKSACTFVSNDKANLIKFVS